MDDEPVDLSRLLIDAVSDATAAGKDHHWCLDLPDEPVTVRGDTARLYQVVANLLANARTHTPPGSTVTARLCTDTRGQVVIAVVDDGPGVPADLLPNSFNGSPAPSSPGPAAPAAPASAWPWCRPSSPPTAAPSGSPADPAGPPSGCGCRPAR